MIRFSLDGSSQRTYLGEADPQLLQDAMGEKG
jgi:hypothetical protein